MQKPLIATMLLLAGTATAHAADWYLLGAVSQSQVNLDSSSLDKVMTNNGATALSSSDSGTANQWRLQIGYKVNPYLSLEAGYIDLGKARYKASFTGGSAKADWSAGGVNVAAVGSLPMDNGISLIGKVGAIGSKTSTDWSSSGISGIPNGKETKNQLTPFAGIGAGYALNDKSDLRLEYERFNGVGDASLTGKADVSIMSLGMTYHF